MLPPIYYESCTDAVLAAYARLEDAILSAMVKRILRMGFVSEATKHQAEMLQEAGLLYEDILQLIAQRTDACTAQVRALFENAGVTAVEIDNQAYRQAGIATVDIRQSDSLWQVLEAGFKKTMGVMDNLTKTTALTTQRTFYQACNDAYMQITSGAFSYQDAIRNVLAQAAKGGLSVTYPSGHVDKLDVAIRRAALTGIGQTAAEVSKTNAEDNGCYLMEITAHSGARPEHTRWQGQLVSLTGKDVGKTIDGLKVWSLSGIGYGSGDGFRGWNCRHDWYPYYVGYSTPNYTKKELEKLNEKNIEWNGEKYTEYEISQMQRAGERKIRKLKRQTMSMQQAAELTDNPELKAAATADYQAMAANLKTAEKNLKEFCKATGQDRDRFREQVLGFNRSTAQKAVHAAKKSGLTSGGRSGTIKEKDMFHTKDDPMREVLGSAEQSHPEELQQFLDYLSERKVDVIRRSGNSSMGYQPGLRRGEPGQIVMEDGASYSAWLHEVQHAKNDESEGWGGMATLFDRDKRWKMEYDAYEKEIEFAKSLKRQDIVERLEILRENERKAIYGE
mgnify:CR=1 FL=1